MNHPCRLESLLTTTDALGCGDDGVLTIDGHSAEQLLSLYGSPLYVISERTLRANYRRLSLALDSHWLAPTRILYAIKANNNLAVRAIMHSEGAGAECFGEGELYGTFLGGADPASVVLNGSNKSRELLRQAVTQGITINVDGEDELAYLAELGATAPAPIRISLRLRTVPEALGARMSDYIPSHGKSIASKVQATQWGFSTEAAERLLPQVLAAGGLELVGYHHHLGRLLPDAQYHRAIAAAVSDAVLRLQKATGYWPQVINLGGGLSRERDPESGQPDLNPTRVEDQLASITAELLAGLGPAGPTPELWMEPGRYLVGNAGVLLGRVGEVRRDLGRIWAHADFSINNLMRIETSGSSYHILPATKLHEPAVEDVAVVGSLCTGAPLSAHVAMPSLCRDDVLAVLDAGMYAETASTQFNGVPRPATVLVSADACDVIKERESLVDVFGKHRVPLRLASRGGRP